MKRKINQSMLLLCLVFIFVLTALLLSAFYLFYSRQMKLETKKEAFLLAACIQEAADTSLFFQAIDSNINDDRITFIAPDGSVVFDSHWEPGVMENHLQRPEVAAAFEIGYGENSRFSSTLDKQTYYYALKTAGGFVLRVAKTTQSISGAFIRILPLVFLSLLFVFLISQYFANRLTKSIITPLNEFRFEDFNMPQDHAQSKPLSLYEELSPFVRTINRQQEKINEQLDELKEKANTMKVITEGMKEGLILLDSDASILSANKSAVNFFDSDSHKNYEGKNILALIRHVDFIHHVKSAMKGKHSDLVLELENNVVQVFLSPVQQEEKINGVIILFMDITEQFNTEKIRREFSANVSHELKTPLTTILGVSEMVVNHMVQPEDIVPFAEKIKDEVSRLIGLIEDIIQLSELDEDKGPKNYERFELLSLVNSVKSRLETQAQEKSISFDIKGRETFITANARMTEELLYNLVDNAIKYNRENGSVTVDWQLEENSLKITVADTGAGIAQEHLDRIFERFYRADKSRSKKTGGSGLGLSIVKHIAAYHQGYAKIESTENEGTTVTVAFSQF